MMVELFLPMLIVLVLTVCFIVVRIQRAKRYQQLDEPDDDAAE
jgi:flagellar biogenesis protein FliO